MGAHPPEVKAKESETLASLQIDDPALLLVQLHLQLVELLPESLLYRIELHGPSRRQEKKKQN